MIPFVFQYLTKWNLGIFFLILMFGTLASERDKSRIVKIILQTPSVPKSFMETCSMVSSNFYFVDEIMV